MYSLGNFEDTFLVEIKSEWKKTFFFSHSFLMTLNGLENGNNLDSSELMSCGQCHGQRARSMQGKTHVPKMH